MVVNEAAPEAHPRRGAPCACDDVFSSYLHRRRKGFILSF